MNPIAVFYHCLFVGGQPLAPIISAFSVIQEQMQQFVASGLMASSSEFHAGVNGGDESAGYAMMSIPRAMVKFHGLQCKNELRTLLMIEEFVKTHPGWNVLYFHSKGATHPLGHELSARWRHCMMRHLVSNWRQCVQELESGFDSVGCHWMQPPQTPPGQNIWGGNFWWATSDFLRTLPSLLLRQRIALSGIDSVESRFEAEVWIGNGPNLPRVKDHHPNGLWMCP